MTEGVTGYRTLAQLGAALPAPARARDGSTAASYHPDPSGPPPAWNAPRWTPITPAFDGSWSNGGSPVEDARDGASPAGWQVPLLPFSLPTPLRVLRDGGGQLIEFHPNDPTLRLTGRHRFDPKPEQPQRTGEARPEGPERDDASSDGGERSSLAKAAMMVGIGGGFLMNGVDVARTIKKYPEALRAARFDPTLGRLGRLPTAVGLTALTRPDSRLIDPAAPRVASAASKGMSFTKFDELAMKSSVLLGTSLAALQIASAIPNLADALGKDGPWYENLALSTSGRAGVLQLAGGSLGMGVFLTALHQTKGQGSSGVINRILTAAKAPIMAKPIFTSIGIGSGMLVMANELGYFDWLNTGEARSIPTVLRESAQRTPILNDPEFRTAGILAAGGVVGYKAHRAMQAAGGVMGGGISGLSRGHWIGGAIVAGLLGAQLLGGLSALNKPAEPS